MSPDIKISADDDAPLASVRVSREVARVASLVLTREVGSPTITLQEELAGFNRIADAFDIAARYSGKRKNKNNP